VVLYSFHFIFADFVRDNRQTMVQLHCITVDYFSIKLAGYLNCQLQAMFSVMHG
jgi:hypothetical protein